jgi:hypothetical protein
MGMNYFSMADWSSLNYLYLSNYIGRQMITRLEVKGANIYPE